MGAAAILWATVRFVLWEGALFAAAAALARKAGWPRCRPAAEYWLAVVAIQVTLESSCAAMLSFAHLNSPAAYWGIAALLAAVAQSTRPRQAGFLPVWGLKGGKPRKPGKTHTGLKACATLAAPLILLSFRPVQEIDSINYLHYLIDWMANRATPYTFASGYVSFWELSFLPAWTVTRVDLFFPLLALKAVVLLALAAWLTGRALGLRNRLLLWTVFGAMLLRYLWLQYSGVPTLKNDALHGAGFVLLTLVVLRAARRPLARADLALLAFGIAFAPVKYTGIILAVPAAAAVAYLQRRAIRRHPRRSALASVAMAGFFLLTSGHFYLRTFLLHGSPFYPFQINFAFIHLPGTADLSSTSILFSLHDPRLWGLFFRPASGLSPAGLLFPLTLAAALAVSIYRLARPMWSKARFDWAAAAILCGWLVYFRSVYSASASPGDLGFLLNDLSTLRYQDGVLPLTELWLVSLLAPYGWPAPVLVGVNIASRLAILYAHIPLALFPLWLVCAVAALGFALGAGARRRAVAFAAPACLILATPFVVERNRVRWTDYWNGLKPALAAARGPELAELALPESGYFAGHAVAAGNPVHPEVRSLSMAEIGGLPAAARPRYVAVLPMPGAAPDPHCRGRLAAWGYVPVAEVANGALLERAAAAAKPDPAATLDAWYAPAGTAAIAGMSVPPGHVLRIGDIVVLPNGDLARLARAGRQPVDPPDGLRIRVLNCGTRDSTGKPQGALYRRQSGMWTWDVSPDLSKSSPIIAQGRFRQETLKNNETGPFTRLTAENDAQFLALAGWYPATLPDNSPVTLRAEVRCPKGCVLAAIGRLHSEERRIPAGGWQSVSLEFVFHRSEDPQHYSVGMNSCRAGDRFDIREFALAPGMFPF